MKRANCPSCGAEVLFRSAASILAVCEYCRSTLLRKDLALENLGRMAELMEDASPVQLGTLGCYRESRFTVVGRIQLKYEAGIWNEWYLFFDDERTGWLGETPGLCAVSFLRSPPEPCPAFETLAIDRHLTIEGRDFQVVNLEQPRCIGGEGELPFQVGAGYDTRVADLHGPGNAFATLDYSETPPLLFLGEQVEFKSLVLTGTRDTTVRGPAAKTQAFQCGSCGAPLLPKAEASVVIVCSSCGSVHDLDKPGHPILYRAAMAKGIQPLIPLGSRGRLRGRDYEIVGFLRRESKFEGIAYPWHEYLLLDRAGGFAWLSEYEGHWNYILPLTHKPTLFGRHGRELIQYDGTHFRHFQTAKARCTYVLGEFYWRVAIGEEAMIRDFIAPPRLVSEERMRLEVLYSIGEYLQGDELRKAFGVERPFPEPVGVYANQPSPWAGTGRGHAILFGLFALLLLVLQIGFVSGDSHAAIAPMTVQMDLAQPEAAQITPGFHLPRGRRDLEVTADVVSGDPGLRLKIDAVDAGSGAPLKNVAAAAGRDPPGHRRFVVHFPEVPAGSYYLAVSASSTSVSPDPLVTATVEVKRASTSWGLFFLALIALAAWPGMQAWRSSAFETRRWMESDHPMAG